MYVFKSYLCNGGAAHPEQEYRHFEQDDLVGR